MKKENLAVVVLVAALIGLVVLILEKNTGQSHNEDSFSPAVSESNTRTNQPTESPMTAKQYDQAPAMQIDESKQYQVVLKTDQGDITIQLNAAQTPITVNNFVFLAKEGFYDGTIFHRAIDGFMIQGGDPEGTGRGGPGYRFADEDFEGEYTRGTVAMANAGPNTNGSQFFIMHQDYPLPANYVIFGQVVEGMEAVDAIATAPVTTSASGEQSKPVTPVTVQSVEIIEQ